MNAWIDLIKASNFPENTRRVFVYAGKSILVFNLKGHYYAIQNQCSHQNLPLEEGTVADGCITCPYHGARFCLKTGAVLGAPAFEDLETYPIRIEKGMIQLSL